LKNRILDQEEIKYFISQNDFGSAAKILLDHQKENWSLLYDGYKSLETVKTKSFQFDGYEIKVQFNPGRIISSSAKVDSQSIKERRCFLCTENLPLEQKGILFQNDYLILCNPYPIFPEHFTISSIEHLPQQIKISFEKFLSLSKDMSSRYTVLYNGPKCGASAPDHLHFQAGNKFFIPIDEGFHILKKKYGEQIYKIENVSVHAVDDGLRRFISLEGDDRVLLIKLFDEFYKTFESFIGSSEEPLMNILSLYENDTGWKVIIFLREKHRPSHYYAGGENNILLSPASVDVGGVCITPLEKDFEKITKEIIQEIFFEVFISKDYFKLIKKRLKEKLVKS